MSVAKQQQDKTSTFYYRTEEEDNQLLKVIGEKNCFHLFELIAIFNVYFFLLSARYLWSKFMVTQG